MKECIKCKTEISDDDMFCFSCGARQTTAEKYLMEAQSSSKDNQYSLFDLLWNKGASSFISNTNSLIQFKIVPNSAFASQATDLSLRLKFPDSENWTDNHINFIALNSSPRVVSINYRPSDNLTGRCTVRVNFSYKHRSKLFSFEQQVKIDVHDDPDKFRDFSVNIGSINQEGKAGDPNINIYAGSDKKIKSKIKILDDLTSVEHWERLELYPGITLDKDNKFSHNLLIPHPFTKRYKSLSLTLAGIEVQLFLEKVTVGRGRSADLVVRNIPEKGESWSKEKLEKMNLYINRTHVVIGIRGDFAFIRDNDTANGTYVNDKKLASGSEEKLKSDIVNTVSLADPKSAPCNIFLSAKIIQATRDFISNQNYEEPKAGAIILKQQGVNGKSSLILGNYVDISSVFNVDSDYCLVCHQKNVALSNGSDWYWLDGSDRFQLDNGLEIQVKYND